MAAILSLLKSYFVLMLLLLVLSHLAPKESYKRFFQFFIGIWMCVLLLRPIVGWLRDGGTVDWGDFSGLEKELSKVPEWEGKEVNLFELFYMDTQERKTETDSDQKTP